MNERRLRALFCDAIALLSVGGVPAAGLGCATPPPASGPVEGTRPQSSQAEPTETSPVVEVSPVGSGGVTELPPQPPKPTKPPSLALDACKNGYPQVLAGLRPATRIDYAELRLVHGMGDGARVRVTSRIGQLCATADSDVACRKSLADLPIERGFQVGCHPGFCTHQIAYTRGDKAFLAATPEAVKELLGPIDSRGDALLLAWANDYELTDCKTLNKNLAQSKSGWDFDVTKNISLCPMTDQQLRIRVTQDGDVKVLIDRGQRKSQICAGRRPAGLRPASVPGADALGRYLAEMAHLEAASVPAFERLAAELEALGAPAGLCRRLRLAADDERRHAEVMTHLARAHGVEPPPVQREPEQPRSVYDIAAENDIEGCVRETFGALIGCHQAAYAADLGLRAAMAGIAQDEIRHAALSWEVGRWLHAQLSSEQRLQLRRLRAEAVAELCAEAAELCVETAAPVSLRAAAGLLDGVQMATALSLLSEQLWDLGAAA